VGKVKVLNRTAREELQEGAVCERGFIADRQWAMTVRASHYSFWKKNLLRQKKTWAQITE
jgi:hypothetical protein